MIKSKFHTTVKWIAYGLGIYALSYLWYTYFYSFGLERFDNPMTGIVIGIVIWGSLIAAWVSTEAFIELQRSTEEAEKIKNLKCLPLEEPHDSVHAKG